MLLGPDAVVENGSNSNMAWTYREKNQLLHISVLGVAKVLIARILGKDMKSLSTAHSMNLYACSTGTQRRMEWV